MVTHGVGQTLH